MVLGSLYNRETSSLRSLILGPYIKVHVYYIYIYIDIHRNVCICMGIYLTARPKTLLETDLKLSPEHDQVAKASAMCHHVGPGAGAFGPHHQEGPGSLGFNALTV